MLSMEPVTFKILVVEDDPDDRWMMDEAFKKLHLEAEVKKFVTGAALLAYLGQVEPRLYPAVIVLDNFLPGLDARKLLAVLKGNPLTSTIHVVVCSTSISPAMQRELLGLGADACYEKGFSVEETVELARRISALAFPAG